MSRPSLTFYCELDTPALSALMADASVIENLKALRAGVSLAIQDFSAERAAAVHEFNREGIPMTAWIVLPQDQGYFSNLGNAPESAARYDEFKKWTHENDLRWVAVGLDIEPPRAELEEVMRDPRSVIGLWLGRSLDMGRLEQGEAAYRALAEQIRADGYRVESYQMPFIVDERRLGSTFLRRFMNLVDVPVDREVLMLYSSLIPPRGPGHLLVYGPAAGAIAVGSTGGGIDNQPKLTWDEFCRDLRIARRLNDEIYVFSLEGCVQHGFLTRIRDINWEEKVVVPMEAVDQAQRVRTGVRLVLWSASHPAILLAIPAGLVLLRSLMSRNRN